MSDMEKIVSRANLVGSGAPIQLRWEGAGNSTHPASLLLELQGRVYTGTTTPIKYNAIINVYEGKDDPILERAVANMAAAHKDAGPEQTYRIWRNADVTRASRSIADQPKAHLIFVRNIMLTTSTGGSRTDAGPELLGLHKTAVRNRANSIESGGQIQLGMSGSPGLNASTKKRDSTPVKKLFSGFDAIVASANGGGLELAHGKNRLGGKDKDLSEVMKNNGTSLGLKNTYYLTFQPKDV